MSIKSAERFLRHSRTRQLSAMLERYIDPHGDPRIYWAKEVTFDYSTNHKIRVDYMRFKPLNNTTSGIEKGDFYAYEIKSSVEDFKSLNGHNFIADYNYYVMPTDIYEAVKDWEEPVAISVLPDHPTPCELRTHTAEPIPFLIWHPGIEADEVRTFDEVAACEGSYGLMKEDEFINEFMSSTTG